MKGGGGCRVVGFGWLDGLLRVHYKYKSFDFKALAFQHFHVLRL